MKANTEWLKTLKPGDVVIRRSWNSGDTKIDRVEKITPTGFIKVNGRLFDSATGVGRGGGESITEAPEAATNAAKNAAKNAADVAHKQIMREAT